MMAPLSLVSNWWWPSIQLYGKPVPFLGAGFIDSPAPASFQLEVG